VLALDLHRAALHRPVAEEEEVEAAAEPAAEVEQVLDRMLFAGVVIADELDPELVQVIELGEHDFLVELEVGDAVEQQSARHRPHLEDGHVVAVQRELFRDGQPRWPAAHDRDAPARRRLARPLHVPVVLADVIGDVRLELADGHRRLVRADHARALAQLLLRADAAADVGHVRRLVERFRGAQDVAVGEMEERAGDVVVQRAGLHAGRVLAQQTPLRLEHGELGRVRLVDFVPVVDAPLRILLGRLVDVDVVTLTSVHARTPLHARRPRRLYQRRAVTAVRIA
jgi:hypothetical protein